jgi:3-oxoacyl-[acyl-carrier protein] reductase
MLLKDKIALVTGASLGIGKATAKLLVEKGAKVIITGRNEERLEKAAQEIGATAFRADAAQETDNDLLFEFLQKQFGKLDILVNNAGIGAGFVELTEVKMEDFLKVYMTNVFGAAMVAQRAANMFKAQNHGNIVNIASTAGLKGFARGTVYASSKFALRGMTQCWQDELRKHNVRVMLVNPSEVKTAFANPEGIERPEEANKLRAHEIAHAIVSALEMDDRGFIPELTVWATNPWG